MRRSLVSATLLTALMLLSLCAIILPLVARPAVANSPVVDEAQPGYGPLQANSTGQSTVTFTESGLPSGLAWEVLFNGRAYSSSSSTIVIGNVTLGTYYWNATSIGCGTGCRYSPSPSGGQMSVPSQTSQLVVYAEQFSVSFASNPTNGGTTSPAGTGWYQSGSAISIVASPSAGYAFSSWSTSGTIYVANASLRSTTATIGGAGAVTANFASAKYNVTFSASGVGPSAGPVLIVDGVSYSSSQFPLSLSWQGGSTHSYAWQSLVYGAAGVRYVWLSASGLSTKQNGTMTTPQGGGSVSASYGTQYQVSFSVSPAGSGSTSPNGTNWYRSGSTVSIGASPEANYRFAKWSVNGSIAIANQLSSQTSATINGTGIITANFATSTYSVAFRETGLANGTLWGVTFDGRSYNSTSVVIGIANVTAGTHSWRVISPIYLGTNARYIAANLTSGVMSVPSQTSQTTSYVEQYNVGVSVYPPGSGTTNPNGTLWYGEGAVIPISTSPSRGYMFKFWNATGSIRIANMSSPRTQATINGAGMIIANFGTPISNVTTTTTITRTTNSTTTTRSTNSTSLSRTNTTSSTTFVSTLLLQNVSTRWDPYTDFYSFLNYGLFKDGGDCYGFSSTAILYFGHYQLGDQTLPYYPEPTQSLAGLTGRTVGYCFPLVGCLTEDTLSQTTFPIYIHETYAQAQLPPDWAQPSNEQTQVQSLMNSIQNGTPVILVLGPTDGHAVIGWNYEEFSNGTLVIGISDPNYGNVPRHAYYTNGQFSYKGTVSWSTFSAISPGMLQWDWLSPLQLSGTVSSTNSYYTYIFSSVPITILGQSGQASFATPGNSMSFNSSIKGVVGFEEGGIQVFGIPKGIQFTIKDPGTTSSMITIIIPQNETSIIGYQLRGTASTPISATIVPTNNKLNVTTSNAVNLSVALFSVEENTHSILNATSIPVASSQTAVFSVPDWGKLNSTQSAANLQVFQSGSSQPVTSYTLTNGQQGLPQQGGISGFIVPLVAVVAAVIIGIGLLAFSSRRRRGRQRQSSI